MHRCLRVRSTVFGRLLAGLLLPLLLSVSQAADDYGKGILDLKSVIAAAQDVTREKYPNADDVLVDDHIIVEYEADGTSVTWDDTIAKILTEKGKRSYQTLARWFTLPYSEASFTLVQVIRPDGTVIPVDIAAQSRTMIDRSQMGSNIYNPNRKVFQVGIPQVEIGDLVRYVAFQKVVKPRVPNTWSDYQVLEYTSPIKQYTYEVRAPKALPLTNIVLKDEIEGTVGKTTREEGDRTYHVWKIHNVPRMYPEPSMPPLSTVVQRLLVSTIADWRDISKWYWKLCEPHLETTPEIRAKVAELTKGVTDREAQIRAIFRFVSQEIRYMGITVEKEAPGYEPHDAKSTFENRHGVCRDKAALLAAMLREAGHKGFPVIIHNGPKKEQEVPQPFFNHAIAAVENPDGTYMLMDPTDENTKELFPAYLCNQSYLVAKPDGETLLTSPIIPAEENMMDIETVAEIDAQGTLTGQTSLHFFGINDNAYRGYFSRIKPVDRKRYFESAVKAMTAGAKLSDLSIEPQDMQDTETPLTVTYRFSAEDVPTGEGDIVMLPVPRLGSSVGMVNFIIGRTGLDKRRFPMETNYACGVRESLKLTVSPAFGNPVALPSYEPIADETLSWQKTLAFDGRLLTAGSEFKLRTVEFSPAQYLALKETLKELEVNARKKPIFRRESSTETEADMIVLSDVTSYELADAKTWTVTREVKKRVLTYKGKKDHSELKLDYNPVWEDVELQLATVTTDGTTKEVSEQELNTMDAGWVGGAPRYPAAKTLVASLPGVSIGSVIHYRYVRRCRERPFFAAVHSFQSFDPIQSRTVRLTAPAGLKLKTMVRSGCGKETPAAIAEKRSEKDGRVTLEWTATDRAALKREPALPPWWSFTPTVFISCGDWAAYAAELLPALTKAAVGDNLPTPANGKTTPREKIRAIRDVVAREIRDAGPSLPALPFSAITPASQTLREGYGNSTDHAVLLYALLKQAGLSPEFVLASYLPREPGLQRQRLGYPDPGLFPSVLVRVPTPGGPVYLNDTNQYDDVGVTGHDGYPGLSLADGQIETIASDPGKDDREDREYRLSIDAAGNAVISRTIRYHGNSFGSKKKSFEEMPPEERRRYQLESAAGISQSAVIQGALETDFDSYPGVERLTVKVPRYAVIDGNYLYFSLPASLRNVFHLYSDERLLPLYRGGPRRQHTTIALELPQDHPCLVLSPPTIVWDAPVDDGRITTSMERTPGNGNCYTVTFDVDLQPAVIPPGAYDDMLRINRRLSRESARTVLLSKKSGNP